MEINTLTTWLHTARLLQVMRIHILQKQLQMQPKQVFYMEHRHTHEVKFAKMLKEAMPGMDKVRFVNSGTEAVMTTIRVARAYTGRTKIMKFAGCYHGHFDLVLVAAGSGPATLGTPDSAGVPKSIAEEVITIPFNNPEAYKEAME